MSSSPSGDYIPWLLPLRPPTPPLHPSPVSVSLNAWALLDPSHSVTPRTMDGEFVSPRAQHAASSTAPHLWRSATATPNVTCGGCHREEVSLEWSILSGGQSHPQSGHDLCDFPTPEHSFSKVPSMPESKLGSFRTEDSHEVSDDDDPRSFLACASLGHPRGKYLRRRTTLPFINSCCFYSLPSMSYLALHLASPFELGNGGASYARFRSVVHPPRKMAFREKIPSESSDAASPESSALLDPRHSPAAGAWEDIKKSEEENTHAVDDGRGGDTGESGSEPDREGNSALALFSCMSFFRSVLRHIELMAADRKRRKVRNEHRRHRRGSGGGTTEEKNGWPDLSQWFSSEMETLLACTLHGIIAFML
ncbi:uncharacterized protein Tco025E_06407 [Trypanosoma conorhini]|uniref:Uncharacterized protein n=1 Tax=Trypanosoma conorhini TaxID=83891 RepID=A0A3R7RTU5_9TRYP|nr:uncharacterized protein Tco025E_06407 [Trypanosoma conorhini]RNF12844.1 hypothetical protein Tco025E_06407 [Trypanosoma conorhini]